MAPKPTVQLVRRQETPRASAVFRADGWKNSVTGLGDYTRDKRMAAQFEADLFVQHELEDIYRGSDMAARIVDRPADDMVRKGFEVLVDEHKDVAEAVGLAARQLGLLASIHQALKWKRAYGGAGILLGADDAQDPVMPLAEDRIRSFDWMTVLTPEELQPVAWYTNANAKNYGKPRLYQIVPIVSAMSSGLLGPRGEQLQSAGYRLVHESRILAFPGVVISRRQQVQGFNYGWGDSVLARVYRVLRDFDVSWDSAAHLVQDFAQAVLKMKGLYDAMASEDPADQGIVTKRVAMMDYTRSTARMVVVDPGEGEDFERKATPMTGLPETLDRFCNRLAASGDIPVTLMMGEAPAGLNATGDSDIRNYYDRIDFGREIELKPQLERGVRLLMLAKNGPTQGAVPKNWSIKLPSLWQLDAVQQADVRLKTAQADEIEIRNQVITPEEVAKSRHAGDEWSSETVLEQSGRDELAAAKQALEGEPDAQDPALADPNAVNPKSALNGVQVTAMLEVVKSVAAGDIPRDAGVAILEASFPVDQAQADRIMGTVGKGFTPPPKPQPPALPPGPGAPPAKPLPPADEQPPEPPK